MALKRQIKASSFFLSPDSLLCTFWHTTMTTYYVFVVKWLFEYIHTSAFCQVSDNGCA